MKSLAALRTAAILKSLKALGRANPGVFRRYVGAFDRPWTALTGAYCYRQAPNAWWLAYDARALEGRRYD